MAERKRYPRLRTLKTGKIVFDRRSCVIDCTVRNLSPNGALLVVASLVAIPERFDLVLGTNGEQRSCRVVWRGEDRLGVEFA